MVLNFYKYQGCGNDFVLIDQRESSLQLTQDRIKFLCDRRFGIGGDGLMELLESQRGDFEMRYYNSDGNASSFCGNGGRCIAQFAKDLSIVNDSATKFLFQHRIYTAEFLLDGNISLNMQEVDSIRKDGEDLILNTGSPHYLHFMSNIDTFDLTPYAHQVRYSSQFPEGINVNLVELISEHTIKMRTYERGVEDETLSCGTGVTAAAIGVHTTGRTTFKQIQVITRGGNFRVEFSEDNDRYTNIKLIGPAMKVYEGTIEIR